MGESTKFYAVIGATYKDVAGNRVRVLGIAHRECDRALLVIHTPAVPWGGPWVATPLSDWAALAEGGRRRYEREQ